MADLINVGDGDLSGGSYPRREGLQKRKRQEEVCCSRETRSLSLKLKLKLQHDWDEQKAKEVRNREMTPAEWKNYRKQVRKSGGFDVCIPDDVRLYTVISPQPNFDKNPWMSETAKRCAREAIVVYNNNHGAEFQFTRVVKLNSQSVQGDNLYITFEAKDKDAAPICFQALVYCGIPKNAIVVKFCHPQPKS